MYISSFCNCYLGFVLLFLVAVRFSSLVPAKLFKWLAGKVVIKILYHVLSGMFLNPAVTAVICYFSSCEKWIIFRVVRRLVTLVSHLAQVQADFSAAQKQAESASAAARQFMEDKENKVKKHIIGSISARPAATIYTRV